MVFDRAARTSSFMARIASSCDEPPARSSSYWSSRCCRSSSLTSSGQSAMLHPGDPADGQDEFTPRVALGGEDVGADWGQPVIAAPALPGLLNPAAQNPAALFQSIEQRVEGGDAEFQHAARSRLDQLAEVVAVSRLILEQREDQQLGAALLQLAIEHAVPYVLHSNILCQCI